MEFDFGGEVCRDEGRVGFHLLGETGPQRAQTLRRVSAGPVGNTRSARLKQGWLEAGVTQTGAGLASQV